MIKLAVRSGLSFPEIIEILRDGKGYRFSTDGMNGYFFKAPITYWEHGIKATPTLMLYDFDPNEADWSIEQTDWPVGLD